MYIFNPIPTMNQFRRLSKPQPSNPGAFCLKVSTGLSLASCLHQGRVLRLGGMSGLESSPPLCSDLEQPWSEQVLGLKCSGFGALISRECPDFEGRPYFAFQATLTYMSRNIPKSLGRTLKSKSCREQVVIFRQQQYLDIHIHTYIPTHIHAHTVNSPGKLRK